MNAPLNRRMSIQNAKEKKRCISTPLVGAVSNTHSRQRVAGRAPLSALGRAVEACGGPRKLFPQHQTQGEYHGADDDAAARETMQGKVPQPCEPVGDEMQERSFIIVLLSGLSSGHEYRRPAGLYDR